LTIRLTGGRWAVSTRDEEKLLATINEGTRKPLMPASRSVRQAEGLRWVRKVSITHGPVYQSQLRGRWFRWGRFFVDADSGEPAVKIVGSHNNRTAGGRVQVLSRPSPYRAGPEIWQFPVEGIQLKSAVMTAVDDRGNAMMRFRRTASLKGRIIGRTRVVGDDAGIDVVLSPGLRPSSELVLIASVASPWMISYFRYVSQ
jgi:hypothetical protein